MSILTDAAQKYVTVEGNIGAGKSTFLTIIKKYLSVNIIYEPHNQWQDIAGDNLLERFYRDPKRWAYTFQSYAFVTRIREQERAFSNNNSRLQVLERSVYCDRYCFAKNCFELELLNSLEWKIYQDWFNWLVDNHVPLPSAFIYLRTDPQVCYQRLLKRNRSEETNISLDYIQKIHEKHEQWLIEKKELSQNIKNIPILVLECNKEFENDEREQQKHIEKIIAFCDKTFYIPAHALSVSNQVNI